MPLKTQRLHHNIRYRLPAPLTLGTIPIGMAVDTPRIPILLHKRRRRIKRIATLSAEEVASMPLRATSDDDFALDRCLAGLAARGEVLVEVQMAVEAQAWLAVGGFEGVELVLCQVFWELASVVTKSDAFETLRALSLGFRIEGHKLEVGTAFVADEAAGVETLAGG